MQLTKEDWTYIYNELSEPFQEHEVGWKPQAFNKTDKNKALLVAYVDARVVSDRLNSVVGAGNWKTEFTPIPSLGKGSDGDDMVGVSCRLSIFDVYREDVGTPSMSEGLKGCYSDALKRAAVHFGVGRYLYELDPVWGELDNYKKVKSPPRLPDWAKPGSSFNADDAIFQLVRELDGTKAAELGSIMMNYNPRLSKVEKKEIYSLIKALRG